MIYVLSSCVLFVNVHGCVTTGSYARIVLRNGVDKLYGFFADCKDFLSRSYRYELSQVDTSDLPSLVMMNVIS